jgi:hypothetical protein
MDLESIGILAGMFVAALGGREGLMWYLRNRNNGTGGQQPPASVDPNTATGPHPIFDAMVTKVQCEAHHEQIADELRKGSTKMDSLRETLTEMQVQLGTGLGTLRAEAAEVADTKINGHERRYHRND